MRILKTVVAGLVLALGLIGSGLAGVPKIINYQGFITQADGTPVPDGTYSISFSIYDALTGGTTVWSSGSQNVDVAGGMFTVQLGASPMTPFPADIMADTIRYLGITIGSDPEIAPRSRMTSTGYSFMSQSADTARYMRNERSFASSGFTYGVYSDLTNTGTGVTYGLWSTVRNPGTPNSSFAVVGQLFSNATERRSIVGVADGDGTEIGYSYGIEGYGYDGYAAYGGYFHGYSSGNNYGVYANGSTYGVYGTCGVSNGNYGGYFYGNLHATGTNTKGGGGYIIDNPLDPENRFLVHNDVESPDMKNVYDGIAVLDGDGRATVTLPDYFEALNRDFRYQLTCIGGYAPVYISEEIEGNRFVIAGGKADMRVSWQVTGIRKDAFARAVKSDIEPYKTDEERGRYLHPEAFGFGMEKSIGQKNHSRDDDMAKNLLTKEKE